VTIFHYGWVRSETQMNLKTAATHKFWDDKTLPAIDYSQIDSAVLKLFSGTHPQAVQDWLPKVEGIFQANPNYKLTAREKKHRRMLWLENKFGLKFSKHHYQLVR
jgi:hypothetical protein